MPRSGTRERAVAAALVLATHALFLTLLQVRGRARPEVSPSPPALAGIRIWLPSVGERPEVRPDTREEPRARSVNVPAVDLAATIPLVTSGDAAGPVSPAQPASVDWTGKASAMAARVGQDAESPPSFGPPLQVMRKPCTPRTHYDKATREQMEHLLPEVHDPVPPGGIAAAPSSVKMGGVRVGVVRIGGGKDKDQAASGGARKSSFRWKWDSPRMGNGGAEQLLTSGFAEPVQYDGMFDDMVAGTTPDSSVPAPDTCD